MYPHQPRLASRHGWLIAGMALLFTQMAQAKEVKIPTSTGGFLVVNVPDDPPATAATPSPKQVPATIKTPKPDPAALQREVAAALQAWATAWSKKNLNTYIAAYTPDYNGGTARKMWEQERRNRIQGKRNIEVKLSGIKIEIKGDKALARFTQDYKADSFSETSSKRVDLVRSGNNWLIAKESTGS